MWPTCSCVGDLASLDQLRCLLLVGGDRLFESHVHGGPRQAIADPMVQQVGKKKKSAMHTASTWGEGLRSRKTSGQPNC